MVCRRLSPVARFHDRSSLTSPATHVIETAFILISMPGHAFHLLVIVWNNAAALRSSENCHSERPPISQRHVLG